MATVTSCDGTTLTYDRTGSGPALIQVDGALCHRAFGPSGPLAEQLKTEFTVFRYDRRGRGGSENTLPYSPDREIEDLQAVLAEAGGSAFVYGVSSGAGLALEAAKNLSGITKLVVYEPPFIVDDSRAPVPEDYPERVATAVESGRRGEAVKLFMKSTGAPGFFVAIMPLVAPWSKLKAVAHTIPYDLEIMASHQHGHPLPAEEFGKVSIPTLAVVGGKSPHWMQQSVRAVASVVPEARFEVLPGQNHMVKPGPLAPVLTGFFKE
ncbi:alpha/beta hydrolase [Amycolatopsis acidicola]|uniref:Alpha/beta hydrolase n=1 Tax=Amycolatopsis acidicola TaxID=2596893 RepID=A0A5N0V1H2_9PSEU|nr:alpha/beta hydrolase [Amycolatopsis acidicola]KAA9159759.1 alpha/beta hydrolase [Amycolatopsis acidicola]